MKFIIHSDDFGLSKGITDAILDAFDNGCLESTSIVPNGYAFDYAIAEYKKRTDFRLALHLNLLEGDPLLPLPDVSLLVNGKGKLSNSFLKLWARSIFLSERDRNLLREQVRNEFRAQVRRVAGIFGPDFPLIIDSHQHFHMVPFISDIVLDLAKEFKFSFVRLPLEPALLNIRAVPLLPDCFSSNVIKHALLNALSKRFKKKLDAEKIGHADYFFGAIRAGQMSEEAIKRMLDLVGVKRGADKTIEVLFHPGPATPDEAVLWKDRPELGRYYLSPWRQKEKDELKKSSLKLFFEGLSN